MEIAIGKKFIFTIYLSDYGISNAVWPLFWIKMLFFFFIVGQLEKVHNT